MKILIALILLLITFAVGLSFRPVGGPPQGSWSMDSHLDIQDLLERVDDELKLLGYVSSKGPYLFGERECSGIQMWTLQAAAMSAEVRVQMRCGQTRFQVNNYFEGRYWSDDQLDHYYLLRNQLFPEVMDMSIEELNIKTLGHPARGVRIEDLEKYDREPLDRLLQQKLTKWKAGEWPSTTRSYWNNTQRRLKRFVTGYGIPMAIGSAFFLWIRRLAYKQSQTSKTPLSVILVCILVYTPIPIPMVGWTTLGATMVIILAYVFGFEGFSLIPFRLWEQL